MSFFRVLLLVSILTIIKRGKKMDVNKSQNNAIGRSIQLEEIFFRVDSEVNEWEYLLTVLGITENDFYDIDSVTIKVDNLIIEEV